MITPELVAALVLAVLMLALAILFHLCLEDHERRLRQLEGKTRVNLSGEVVPAEYWPPIPDPLPPPPPIPPPPPQINDPGCDVRDIRRSPPPRKPRRTR